MDIVDSFDAQIFGAHGALQHRVLTDLAKQAETAGDEAALRGMLSAVERHLPDTFEGAYRIFFPVMHLLDRPLRFAGRRNFDLEGIVTEWATTLGLLQPRFLNAMLEMMQPLYSAEWLLRMGGDANQVVAPDQPENLTVLGIACRSMRGDGSSDDTVREMIRSVLDAGQVPYSVAPRYDGDPDAQDLFDAVLASTHGAGAARTVLFDAMEMLAARSALPAEAQEALGRVCLDHQKMATYQVAYAGAISGNNVMYHVLSYARFADPHDWVRAFGNVSNEARFDQFLFKGGAAAPRRLACALLRDGAPVDLIQVAITEDNILCTLLQAACFCGKEASVKLLIEAGADPLKKTKSGSVKHQITGLDAMGLWASFPHREPSQALSACSAKRAIGAVIEAAKGAMKKAPGEF